MEVHTGKNNHSVPPHEGHMTVLAWYPVRVCKGVYFRERNETIQAFLPSLLCALGPVQAVQRLWDEDKPETWPDDEEADGVVISEAPPVGAIARMEYHPHMMENLRAHCTGRHMPMLPASTQKGMGPVATGHQVHCLVGEAWSP